MEIYIINLIILSIWAFLLFISRLWNTNFGRILFLALASIQLVSLQGLRSSSVGTDTIEYLTYYKAVQNYDFQTAFNHRFEIGYKFLNKLMAELGFNDQMFLMGISAMIIIPVIVFIYKYSHNIYLSVFFYITFGFYGASFNTLRQNIAYGFILLSFKYIKERRFFPFIALVIFASSFHISALVFIPAYFLAKIRLTLVKMILISSVALIILVLREEIMNFIVNYIFTSYSIVNNQAYSWFVFNIFLFIILMFFYKNTFKKETPKIPKVEKKRKKFADLISPKEMLQKKNPLFENHGTEAIRMYYIITLSGILLMLFASVGGNVMRVVDFYHLFIIILIPSVINLVKNKYAKLALTVFLFLGMIVVYIYFLSNPGDHGSVPYHFFWK